MTLLGDAIGLAWAGPGVASTVPADSRAVATASAPREIIRRRRGPITCTTSTPVFVPNSKRSGLGLTPHKVAISGVNKVETG